VLAIVGTLVILKICDLTVGLRVSKAQEVEGLDVSMHGEEGYYSSRNRRPVRNYYMKKIEAIIQPFKLDEVKEAMKGIGIDGMTSARCAVTVVRRGIKRCTAAGVQRGPAAQGQAGNGGALQPFEEVLKALSAAARTGKIGDGKIFVYDVAEAIRIRNDDRGESAL